MSETTEENAVKEITDAVNCVKVENGTAKTESASEKSDGGVTFTEQFRAFSKFGDTKSDGKTITLSQSDKWMKQAKVIDGKTITSTDTGIHFKKLKTLKVSLADYNKFLDDLAKTKKIEVKDLKNKMKTCGAPSLSGAAASARCSADETVRRLTDTSRYTGTQKLRFDSEGKGKGNKDGTDNTGYVTGYQNKDSFGK